MLGSKGFISAAPTIVGSKLVNMGKLVARSPQDSFLLAKLWIS